MRHWPRLCGVLSFLGLERNPVEDGADQISDSDPYLVGMVRCAVLSEDELEALWIANNSRADTDTIANVPNRLCEQPPHDVGDRL
jgi:hypothetical protein